MIYLLTKTLEYQDTEFINDLSKGMPIAGPIPATPGLTAREKCAEFSYQEWKKGTPERNAKIFDRVLKSQNTELNKACWEKTLTEIAEGWITEPIDVTEAMLQTIPLTPRYAISEQHNRAICW